MKPHVFKWLIGFGLALYFASCGVQTDSRSEVDSLADRIKKMIRAHYAEQDRLSLEIIKQASAKGPNGNVDAHLLATPAAFDHVISELRGMAPSARSGGAYHTARSVSAQVAVLQDWREAQGLLIPVLPLNSNPRETIFATKKHVQALQRLGKAQEWSRKFQDLSLPEIDARGSEIQSVGNLSSQVYLLGSGENRRFVRALKSLDPADASKSVQEPVDSLAEADLITTARRTLMASLLNEALGLDSAARSELVRIRTTTRPQGVLAVASQRVPGKELSGTTPVRFLSDERKVANGHNLLAFEFLISQMDLHINNVRFEESASMARTFDFDKAFEGGYPLNLTGGPIMNSALSLVMDGGGFVLPDRYEETFIQGILGLNPTKLIELLGDHATADEMLTLLFRREVIIRDLKSRQFIDATHAD